MVKVTWRPYFSNTAIIRKQEKVWQMGYYYHAFNMNYKSPHTPQLWTPCLQFTIQDSKSNIVT